MKGQEVKEAPGSFVEPYLDYSIALLNETIRHLQEVIDRFKKVRASIKELREWYGDYRA